MRIGCRRSPPGCQRCRGRSARRRSSGTRPRRHDHGPPGARASRSVAGLRLAGLERRFGLVRVRHARSDGRAAQHGPAGHRPRSIIPTASARFSSSRATFPRPASSKPALQEHEATHRALEHLRLELARRRIPRPGLTPRFRNATPISSARRSPWKPCARSWNVRSPKAAGSQTSSRTRPTRASSRTRRWPNATRECRNLQSVLERYETDQQRLESDIEQSATEREQFEAMVKQRETTRQRTLVEHATARMHFERALTEATSRGERLARTLTDQSTELQNMGRQLESLAKQFGSPEGNE